MRIDKAPQGGRRWTQLHVGGWSGRMHGVVCVGILISRTEVALVTGSRGHGVIIQGTFREYSEYIRIGVHTQAERLRV
jgi:hypothetical protein